jgi:hypothetical protein
VWTRVGLVTLGAGLLLALLYVALLALGAPLFGLAPVWAPPAPAGLRRGGGATAGRPGRGWPRGRAALAGRGQRRGPPVPSVPRHCPVTDGGHTAPSGACARETGARVIDG